MTLRVVFAVILVFVVGFVLLARAAAHEARSQTCGGVITLQSTGPCTP